MNNRELIKLLLDLALRCNVAETEDERMHYVNEMQLVIDSLKKEKIC